MHELEFRSTFLIVTDALQRDTIGSTQVCTAWAKSTWPI